MFSNLSQNSIIYVLDLKGNPKILNGIVERVSVPRPKYNTFNPNMEMVVDITASIEGDRREFKGVPNNSLANFGDNAFILAENKEVLNSYINSMLQNSKSIVNSVEKHQGLIEVYEEALQELNPDIKANKEKDKAISNLQGQIEDLKETIQQMMTMMTNKKSI